MKSYINQICAIYGFLATSVTFLQAQTTLPLINRNDQLAAGSLHSISLKQDGSVSAWGNNDNQQVSVPSPNSGFVAVAAGTFHSAAVKSNGVMVTWGSNSNGQLDIPGENINFYRVAAGDYHTLGLRKDGSIVAFGRNDFGQTTVPAPNASYQAVAAGASHSIALKYDGSIVAWGRNTDGQCNVPSPNIGFVAIAAGSFHSVGLKSDGSLIAFGRNAYGQCTVPTPNSDYVAISAGISHTIGLKSSGSVIGFGRNLYSVLQVPTPNSNFVSIATADYRCVAMKSDGTMVSWGRNDRTQSNPPAINSGFITPENARPVMKISPLTLDFGTVLTGANVELPMSITNIGGSTLAGGLFTVGDYSVTSSQLYNLTSGQSQGGTIRFTPTTESLNNQSVTFTGVDYTALQLSGRGIYPAPTITSQPVATQADVAGSDATFTVESNHAISWQWYKNGIALQNGGRITGAIGPVLKISKPELADVGSYTCVVTTGGGSTTTEAAPLTVVPNLPVAVISTKPTQTNERELLTLRGSGTGSYSITNYGWFYVKLDENGSPLGTPAFLGSSGTIYTKAIPPGNWRISFQVQDTRTIWSQQDSFDLVVNDVADLADLSVTAAKTKMVDAIGERIWNPAVGEQVYIETEIQNVGYGEGREEDSIVVTVFEDTTPVSMTNYKVADFLALAGIHRGRIEAGGTATVKIPWIVGNDATGNPITSYGGGYPDGARVLTVQAEYVSNRIAAEANNLGNLNEPMPVPEATYFNNQTSFGIFIGPVNGTYAMNVQIDLADSYNTCGSFVARGKANYVWGSKIPVKGAEVKVTINGIESSKRISDTEAPNGTFAVDMGVLPAGNHTVKVEVFDNRLLGSDSETFTVIQTSCGGGSIGGSIGGGVNIGGGGGPPPPGVPSPPPPVPPTYVDLVVNDIQFAGLGLYDSDQPGVHGLTGGQIQVSAVIQNIGTQGTDQPFFVRLVRTNLEGANPIPSELIDSPFLVDGIAAGETKTITLVPNSTWPEVGAFTITATADSTGQLAESNEYNNDRSEILTIHEPAPDLRPYPEPTVGSGLNLSNDRPVVGQALTLYGEVWNVGSLNLLPSQNFKTTVTIAGHKNGLAYSRSFPVEGVIIENGIPINTKASFQVSLSASETADFGAGVNYITISADSLEQITEMREINNARSHPVTFYSQPLWLTEFTIDPSQLVIPTSDPDVDLLVEIENYGVENSTGSVSFYRDSVSLANLIGISPVNPIAPQGGKGTSFYAWMSVPQVAGQTQVIAQLGESRLVRTLKITNVPKPDVHIRSTDIAINPTSPHRVGTQGEYVTVSAYIKNLSLTQANNVKVNFYADSPTRYQWLGEVSLERLNSLDGDINGRVLVQAPQQFEANETAYALLVSITHDSEDASITDNEATTSFTVDLPIAIVGANQQAYTNQTVQLSSSGSLYATQYLWTVVSKPTNSLASISNTAAAFPTLQPDKPGVYTLELIVSDGAYSSEPSFMEVTAIAPAQVVASVEHLDFTGVYPGATWQQSFQVTNTGGESLVGTATASGSFQIISGQNYTLQPGASSTVTLRFTAAALGNINGVLNLTGGTGASIPLSASVAVPSEYGVWAEQFGLTGQPAAPEFVSGTDGITNFIKWKLGISPVDALDGVGLSILGKTVGDVRLRIGKVKAGLTYILQRDLDFSGNWSSSQVLVPAADTTNVVILDANSLGRGAYRLAYQESVGLSSGIAVPVTGSVGIQPVALPGANTGTSVALPFVNNPHFKGTIASVSGSQIFPTNPFSTPDAFSSVHVLVMKTGLEAGRTLRLVLNTAAAVSVNGTLPTSIAPGDRFEIVPLHTLNSLFGGVSSNGPIQLAGGPSASSADIVVIGSNRYFYKRSGANSPGWKLESAPNAVGDLGSVTIADLVGVTIYRKSTTLNLNVIGNLRKDQVMLQVATGSNLLSWPSPQEVTLLDTGLEAVLQGASTPAAADKVVMRGVRYFYKTSGTGAPGWKLESAPDSTDSSANQLIINTGGIAFGIIRNGSPLSITITGLYSE